MDTDQAVAIRTVALTKYYKSGTNDLVIFEDLDLEVQAGEKLALVGESGAGKSTLLHLLGGLDRPTRGKILFGDADVAMMREPELASFRNRQIGFVSQSHYLLPEFTAAENVAMPLLIRGVGQAEAAGVALERLAEVGLAGRAHHRAGELSGGEQQRVVLARALAGAPRVLLADEPTGSLDYKTGEKIADLFDEVHRRNRLTSIFVTHNLEFAKRCDRILQLRGGVVMEPGLERNVEDGHLADLQRENLPGDTARREDGKTYV